jgi:predicted nucleotidyltransferase
MREPNVVNMLFGSHLYGLNTPTSDEDFKGIYIPTLKELLLHSYPDTVDYSTGPKDAKNSAGDTDITVHSLSKFVRQA